MDCALTGHEADSDWNIRCYVSESSHGGAWIGQMGDYGRRMGRCVSGASQGQVLDSSIGLQINPPTVRLDVAPQAGLFHDVESSRLMHRM